MQTNLEKKAITKRKELEIKNAYDPIKEYGESQAKKGGVGTDSLVNHTLTYFDTSNGGDSVDQEQRKTHNFKKQNKKH